MPLFYSPTVPDTVVLLCREAAWLASWKQPGNGNNKSKAECVVKCSLYAPLITRSKMGGVSTENRQIFFCL